MAIKLNITADEIELKTNRLESLDNVKEHEDGYPTGKATKDYVDSTKLTVDDRISDTSENPVQNSVIKSYIDTNTKTNKRIKFILADLGDACSCGIAQTLARVYIIAAFDLSKLNFTIAQGYECSMQNIIVDDEEMPCSMIEEYIRTFDTLVSDLGSGWMIEDGVYSYVHEYNFGTTSNAQAVAETLNSDLSIAGFSINLDYHEPIQVGLK